MWRSLCDWWLSQNSVTNVSIIYRLSICYSALFNSYFWAFKCEMWVLKFIVLGNATGLFKNHLKAIYLYLSTNIFFFKQAISGCKLYIYQLFLRHIKTLKNSTTVRHFRYFQLILADLTGLYSHQTCISDT